MRHIGISKMVRLAILAVLLLSTMGCRSISSGDLVENPLHVAMAHIRVSTCIDTEFVPVVQKGLHEVGWTFRRWVNVPIIGHVGGYYNPFLDHITLNGCYVSSEHHSDTIVHELLHRVWFRNMWPREKVAFAKDIDRLFADDDRTEFESTLRGTLNGLHPLNRLLWYTEAYSYTGEMIIRGGNHRAMVPPELIRHYEPYLVKAGKNYVPLDPHATPVASADPTVLASPPPSTPTPDQH